MAEYSSTKQFKMVADFQCMADECPDHCCTGWRVSINEATKKLYAQDAPELLDFIIEDEKGSKVDKNFETGNCSQLLDGGLCNIHKNYGENFLPDTCYFYPQTARALGDVLLVSATTSCPAATRHALFDEDPFALVDKDMGRMPEHVIDFKSEDENAEDVLKVIQRFIQEAMRDDMESHDVMMRIVLASKMLDNFQAESWHQVLDQIFDLSEHVYIKPTNERISKFELLQFLADLKTSKPERWNVLFHKIESMFRVKVRLDDLEPEIYFDKEVQQRYHEDEETYKKIDNVIKRYIAAELTRNIFPYAGNNGMYAFEKAMVIAIQSTVLKIAIIAHIGNDGKCPSDDELLRITQTLSRGLNHLSRDVVQYYTDKGLLDESKLHQVIYMY